MEIKEPTIGIVGLGYVGLPLAQVFSAKYNVVGFDVNDQRIKSLNERTDITEELDAASLGEMFASGFKISTELEILKSCDVIIVTVPTPVTAANLPDLQPLVTATQNIAKIMKKGCLVVYESTVYPGVTEEVCATLLEAETGWKLNSDFFVGYSPERINPGDSLNTVATIPKLTSGSNEATARYVDELYSSVLSAKTHLCKSIKIAEASKVIENTQRDVNIALMNEISIILSSLDIDTTEVLKAAATKWNFLPFQPGLVGGHCIGVDPYYLVYKSQQVGYQPNLILSARQINDGMGKWVAEKVVKLCVQKKINISTSRILVLGYTFKENCPDTRNTKVHELVTELESWVEQVDIFDPYLSEKDWGTTDFNFVDKYSFDDYSAIIIAVAHNEFKTLMFESRKDQVIFDVKSITKGHIDGSL